MKPELWYVVDSPWGDGSWINADSPDPHHTRFVCDCAPPVEIEEAAGSPAERAETIVRDHNERGRLVLLLGAAQTEQAILRALLAEAAEYVERYGDTRKDAHYQRRFRAAAEGQPLPDEDDDGTTV